MSVNGTKLTPRQERTLAAMLSEPTLQEAAAKAGIAEGTLHRWLRTDDFADAYREARRRAVQAAIAHLQQTSSEAVKALQEVMSNPSAKDSARVTAARTVLEFALKAIELEDLERRVEALEARGGGQR